MRRVLPPRAAHEADLPALVVDDLLGAADETLPQRPPWAQIAAFSLAIIAVGALVTIGWQVHDEDRVVRHQACITAAEAKGAFTQSAVAIQVALA